MDDRSVIIIGAGLAGLSTGFYAQINGYKTKIFEMANKSGGVCVSWKRNDYSFDYAAHNIFGISTRPTGTLYNRLWKELNALKGTSVHSFNEFVQIEDPTGKVLTVYSEVDKLEEHMKELSPIDRGLIEEFTHVIRKLSGRDVFGSMFGGLSEKLRILPLMSTLMKYGKMNLRDYGEKFSDAFLKKAIPTIQYDISEVPVLVPMVFLSMLNAGDAGWPIGGSAALSRNIERQYLDHGGKVHYSSKVKKIIVENDVAKGVQLEDGSTHFADLIISAADGYSTVYCMLDGRYSTELIDSYYKSYPKTQYFGLEIWYGVNRSFTDEPHAMVLFLDQPIIVEGKERDRLDIEIFNFDISLAPAGKTVIKVNFESEYDYWKELSLNKEKYREHKKSIANDVAQRLENRFSGFVDRIEAVDVVTPISVEHWTGGYRGFAQPWPAPEGLAEEINKKGVSKTLPGLQNFYMVGQWAGGTFGITTVCLMGRNLVQDLCKRDHKSFKTG